MQCPKDKGEQLTSISKVVSNYSQPLAIASCSACQGEWISANDYQAWLGQQVAIPTAEPIFLAEADTDYVPSPLDVKAGLCPECGSYLTRLRIYFTLKRSFYLERCSCCGGIWGDRGEFEILQQLNLHSQIPHLFSSKWQSQVRESHKLQQEYQDVVEKLGEPLTQRLLDLIKDLAKHSDGAFAANYLTRQLEKSVAKSAENPKPEKSA